MKKSLWRNGSDLFFGTEDVKNVRKIPPPKITSTTICQIAQNFVITPPPFFVDIINAQHLTLKPTVNIILFNKTISKWVKTYRVPALSYQTSYLLVNLCYLKNTKPVFFQVNLLKVKTKSKMNELLLNAPPFWIFDFVYI